MSTHGVMNGHLAERQAEMKRRWAKRTRKCGNGMMWVELPWEKRMRRKRELAAERAVRSAMKEDENG